MDHVEKQTRKPHLNLKPLETLRPVDGGPFFPYDPELLALDACSRCRMAMWVGSALSAFRH